MAVSRGMMLDTLRTGSGLSESVQLLPGDASSQLIIDSIAALSKSQRTAETKVPALDLPQATSEEPTGPPNRANSMGTLPQNTEPSEQPSSPRDTECGFRRRISEMVTKDGMSLRSSSSSSWASGAASLAGSVRGAASLRGFGRSQRKLSGSQHDAGPPPHHHHHAKWKDAATSPDPVEVAIPTPPSPSHDNQLSPAKASQDKPLQPRPSLKRKPHVAKRTTSPAPPPVCCETLLGPESEEQTCERLGEDMEQHTMAVYDMWTDLKQWRAETKQLGEGSGAHAVLLGLRHMVYQMEAASRLAILQHRIALRLSTLSSKYSETMPSYDPLCSAMRSERWTLSRSLSTTQRWVQAITSRDEDIEAGYSDAVSLIAPGNKSHGVDEIIAALQEEGAVGIDEISVDPGTGTLQVPLQLFLSAMTGALRGDRGRGSAISHTVEVLQQQRESVSKEVESLQGMLDTIKEQHREKQHIHQQRLLEYERRVQSLEQEKGKLLDLQQANEKRVEQYVEAFEEYRNSMTDLRQKCSELNKENFLLRRKLASAVRETAVAVVDGTPSHRGEEVDLMLSPEGPPPEAPCESSPALACSIGGTAARTSPSPRWPCVSAESRPPPQQPRRESRESMDEQFEELSKEMESRLHTLSHRFTHAGLLGGDRAGNTPSAPTMIASPTLSASPSLAPHHKATRSLSPWRYLPPTPELPRDYSPSRSVASRRTEPAMPPFVDGRQVEDA